MSIRIPQEDPQEGQRPLVFVFKTPHVTITSIAHETEVPSRVRDAVLAVAGADLSNKAEVTEERLSGHFNTRLVKFSATLDGRLAQAFFDGLPERLSWRDCQRLAVMMHTVFDEETTTLFLRFEKQESYRDGMLRLCISEGIGGSVSAWIKFTRYPPAKPSDVMNALRKLFTAKATQEAVENGEESKDGTASPQA